MKFPRSAVVVRLLPLVAILLLGCGGGGGESGSREQGGPPEASGKAGPAPHVGGTLVVGFEADVDALNPLIASTASASDVYGNLFIYLCRMSEDMQSYEPWGAESWEFSKDRKKLTFHLRDDIYWHDGAKMTASDVEFSFRLYKNPVLAWSSIRWLDFIESVTAVDSFTVEVRFSKVYPYQLTDANVFRPLPKHLLEHVAPEDMQSADFNLHPVGNGPFKFKEWVPQQYVEIVANEDYFLGRPYLDRVRFKVVPDQTSLLTQLETGEIDFYHHFPPSAYERLSKNPNLRIYRYPSRTYYYIGWNCAREPFSSRNVRRALTMAINRQEIIDALCYGLARPTNSHFLSWLWAHDPTLRPIPYAPEAAKRLLEEEGWRDHDGDGWLDRNGKRFEFELLTNENNQLRKDICVMVQSRLKEIGVKVNVRTMEWTSFVNRLQNEKDFDAVVSGWNVGIKADLTSHFHTRSIPNKFNFVSYSNPEVDSLIDAAVVELDRDKAKRLWSKAQQIILDDAPYTFLFNLDDLNALHKRFKNVKMVTYGWDYNLPEWYVPEDEIKYRD